MKCRFRNILYLLFSVFFICASSLSVAYSYWNIAHDIVSSEATPTKTIEPVCYTKSDKQRYTSIEKAIEIANNRSNETVVVTANAEITKDVIVESGTTLLIPYNESEGERDFIKGTVARKYLVKITNGSMLTIERDGTLIIGAQIHTTGITGSYSELSLDKESKITINGTGYIYGKITETNEVSGYSDPNNVVYDNSNDSNRFINVTSTGKLITTFASYDMGSGSSIVHKNEAGICPTYNFEFPCLGTYTTFEHGSLMYVIAYFSVSGAEKDAEVGLICPPSKESSINSMFYINSGSIGVEYCGTKKTIIYVNGSAKMGALYISAMGVTIDTSKMFAPISNYIRIYVNGDFDTNNKSIKFLPGSYLNILKGSHFNINGNSNTNLSKVLFYNATTLTSINITSYGNTDSTFINSGTITLNQYGALAGYVTTENNEGTAQIDLSSISDSSRLSFSTIEGTTGEKTTPILDLKGPFYSADETNNQIDSLFECGTVYNSYSGFSCWEGNIVKTMKITINVLKINPFSENASSEAFKYSIYSNTTSSDNGQKMLFEKINNVRNQEISLEKNTYIKVIDNLCNFITINGNVYASGTWLQITTNLNFEITPAAAFKITCNHTTGTQGAGQIKRSITYGESSNNLNELESKSDGGSVTAIIPKGWIFKVSDNANVKGESKVVRTTYDVNGEKTDTTIATSKKSIAWSEKTEYIADGDYLFTSDNVNCFTKGTPILLSNGAYKNIENITYNDEIMTWNFFTGKFESQKISILVDHGEEEYTVTDLLFSDGSKLSIAGDHGIFDYDENKFVYLSSDNYKEYIGHNFVKYNNNDYELVKLVGGRVYQEVTNAYSITSYYNSNAIAGDLLTAPPPGEFYNWIQMADKLRYDVEAFNNDVNTYGLYDYSVFEPYGISYETFIAFNGAYLRIPVSKGIFTFEDIIILFNTYKDWIETDNS